MFSGELHTTPLGDNLHLVAVTADTTLNGTSLKPDTTYSYDLEFDDFAGFPAIGTVTLATPKVFGPDGDVSRICYGKYWRPTFALPPALLKDLHILHGSCRKPHGGEGEIDALPHADIIIERYHDQPTHRPHQFYHTGDQIYADDVASVLLYMIDDASKQLFGWVEALNGLKPALSFAKESATEPLPEQPGYPTDLNNKYSIRPGQRLKVVQQLAGFSSDVAGSSHLIRFAEYSCMYLFAWSDVLWPTDSLPLPGLELDIYPSFGQVLPLAKTKVLQQVVLPGLGTAQNEMVTADKNTFDGQLDAIHKFRTTLPVVRRILANVPSYMMCDDHEVTDDWFIGHKWCQRVYGGIIGLETPDPNANPIEHNLFGRRVVQNGIAAFAVFQAWGNKPYDFRPPVGFTPFEGKPESALLGWLAKLAAERGQDQATWLGIQSKVLPSTRYSTLKQQGNAGGRETLILDVEGVLDYSFAITFNNFLLLAINSRTERGLVRLPIPRLGPALLHPEALRRQVRDKVAHLPSQVQITLVICPAPVFGHGIVEGLGQKAVAAFDNILVTPLPYPREEKARLNKGAGFINKILSPRTGLPLLTENDYVLPADTDSNEGGDREGWSFHPECMESLLKELSVCKKIVLFSGDVHYGFSPVVDYHRQPNADGYPEKAAFMQLVCSSMKNATGFQTNAMAAGFASGLMLFDPRGYTYGGWTKPGFHTYEHILTGTSMTDMLQKRVTPDNSNFFFTQLYTLGDLIDAVVDPPEWSYTIHFQSDGRDPVARLTYPGGDASGEFETSIPIENDPDNPQPFEPTIPAAPKSGKMMVNARYLTHYDWQRGSVGHNQIGQVFLDLDQDKRVYHYLWYKLPEQAEEVKAGPITQHILPIPPV